MSNNTSSTINGEFISRHPSTNTNNTRASFITMWVDWKWIRSRLAFYNVRYSWAACTQCRNRTLARRKLPKWGFISEKKWLLFFFQLSYPSQLHMNHPVEEPFSVKEKNSFVGGKKQIISIERSFTHQEHMFLSYVLRYPRRSGLHGLNYSTVMNFVMNSSQVTWPQKLQHCEMTSVQPFSS